MDTKPWQSIMKNKSKIFRRNKLKDLLFFLICSLFVALAYVILEEDPWMGWLGISFFGFGAISFLIHFLTNYSYLKLNEEGFEVKSLFHTKTTKWSEVKDFRQANFRGNKMICFDYIDKHNNGKKNKKLSKFLSGNQGAVQSSYNIKAEELLKLMKNYKRKSKRKSAQ